MTTEELLEKPIWQMTGEEFISLVENNIQAGETQKEENGKRSRDKEYVYGIRGIANLMNCSISTANRIKKKGILDDAIIQQGRTIMVEVDKALELLKEHSD